MLRRTYAADHAIGHWSESRGCCSGGGLNLKTTGTAKSYQQRIQPPSGGGKQKHPEGIGNTGEK